jgi:hypothetical protein
MSVGDFRVGGSGCSVVLGCSRPSMNSLPLYAANEWRIRIKPRLFPRKGQFEFVPLSILGNGRQFSLKEFDCNFLGLGEAHFIRECRAHLPSV